VIAVHVVFGTEPEEVAAAREFQQRWSQWRPDAPLVLLDSAHRVLGPPIARYVRTLDEQHVVVLIGRSNPSTGGSGRCSTAGAARWPATSDATPARWSADCISGSIGPARSRDRTS
jgi:hypothetical protein